MTDESLTKRVSLGPDDRQTDKWTNARSKQASAWPKRGLEGLEDSTVGQHRQEDDKGEIIRSSNNPN